MLHHQVPKTSPNLKQESQPTTHSPPVTTPASSRPSPPHRGHSALPRPRRRVPRQRRLQNPPRRPPQAPSPALRPEQRHRETLTAAAAQAARNTFSPRRQPWDSRTSRRRLRPAARAATPVAKKSHSPTPTRDPNHPPRSDRDPVPPLRGSEIHWLPPTIPLAHALVVTHIFRISRKTCY